MRAKVDQLLQAALTLSEADRIQLVESLMATLEPENAARFDDAWRTEIQRRSDEFDAGLVRPVPWSEVKKRIGQ
jgi:putative addiction module component (TIGR02574 family)